MDKTRVDCFYAASPSPVVPRGGVGYPLSVGSYVASGGGALARTYWVQLCMGNDESIRASGWASYAAIRGSLASSPDITTRTSVPRCSPSIRRGSRASISTAIHPLSKHMLTTTRQKGAGYP